MRICFTTLGCKLNLAETDAFAIAFRRAGHQVVHELATADVHVVHGCTVTAEAARATRQMARRGGRCEPPVRTVVTGCYPTAAPAEAQALPGVSLVVTNPDKERLVELVEAAFPDLCEPRAAEETAGDLLASDPLAPLPALGTRALVKIEDGCNLRCSFCIIPATRGRQRSRPASEVVAEVRARVDAGHREVVLTGVQISAYRDPGSGAGLAALVDRVLGVRELDRLRLTSLAPWDIDPELAARFGDARLCPHLHLSLQSGADPVLRRMRRPYRAADYAAVVAELRRHVPGLALTTDLIVGFPGETDADHRESLRFVAEQGFAAVHVFPYSQRPETAAASWPEQVAPAVREVRRQEALALAASLAEDFVDRHLGQTVEVLWESERDGWRQGLTPNYLRVLAPAAVGRQHQISRVQLASRRGQVAVAAGDALVPGPGPAWAQ
jgi:threonylcarbamoyladenosine tRNA methylthiotransferase MtaB